MELNVSLFVPADNPATQLLQHAADTIRDRSDGKLTLRLFPSEALGSTASQYELARSGKADISYIMHGATPGLFPLTELAALPFVTADPISGTKALLEVLPQYLQPEHNGVKVLFIAANAPMAVHSVGPLHRIGDLHGKRIRHAGAVVAATLSALGAIPANIMPLDVRNALTDGRIDGAAMTFEGAMINRLANAVTHSLLLNANTVTFGLLMNAERYRSLPDVARFLVDDVLGPRAGLHLAQMLADSVEKGRQYMEESGVRIVALEQEDRRALRPLLQPVTDATIGRLIARGLPAAAVVDALTQGAGPTQR